MSVLPHAIMVSSSQITHGSQLFAPLSYWYSRYSLCCFSHTVTPHAALTFLQPSWPLSAIACPSRLPCW